jgi:hypothetical protein
MDTVKLGFGTDPFFEFLGHHPQVGRYFAVGERVIVVVDGVAYETVAPEEGALDIPLPSSEEAATSELPLTSPPPEDAGEVYTGLSADVVEGDAPLAVNFTGRLVGGSDNSQDYYCVESAFEFGDGMVQSAIPGCVQWTRESVIQRKYSASYVYEEPGVYQVTFSLADTHSEPLTIVVHDPAEVRKIDEPATTEEPTLAEADEGPDSGQQSESGGIVGRICLGPLGLALLPLIGAFRFSRER